MASKQKAFVFAYPIAEYIVSCIDRATLFTGSRQATFHYASMQGEKLCVGNVSW